MPLTVDVVAPDRTLWSGQASFVSVQSMDGSLGVYPGHEPLLSLLAPGRVKVVQLDGKDWTVDVVRGFISMDNDVVTIGARPADSDTDDHVD